MVHLQWTLLNEGWGVQRLYYAILYKGLEHLWILVSAGGPGTNAPHGYRGGLYVLY